MNFISNKIKTIKYYLASFKDKIKVIDMRRKQKYSIQRKILSALIRKKVHEKKEFIKQLSAELKNKYRKNTEIKYIISRKIKKMIEDGFITEQKAHVSYFLRITKKGKQKYYQMKFLTQTNILPTKWDGKWRLILIDTKKGEKETQDAIRYFLKRAHFIQIKSSLWASPFPLEETIREMKENLSLENEILIFLSETLDRSSEERMRKIFLKRIVKEKKDL